MAAFPFNEPVKRPGQIPLPRFVFDDHLGYMESQEFQDAFTQWFHWHARQPDGALLMEDFHQRQLWVVHRGEVPSEQLNFWRYNRQVMAQKLRQRGEADVLDKWWANNPELRELPPTNP